VGDPLLPAVSQSGDEGVGGAGGGVSVSSDVFELFPAGGGDAWAVSWEFVGDLADFEVSSMGPLGRGSGAAGEEGGGG
jgi:hypothetical protein